MKKVVAMALVLLSTHGVADNLEDMRTIKVIEGVTSYQNDGDAKDIFQYRLERVGEALIHRSGNVCDYVSSTISGYQDVVFYKGDGEKVEVEQPILEQQKTTGYCTELKKKMDVDA